MATHLSENYREVLYWKLSDHKVLLLVLNLAGGLLIGVAAAMFIAWAYLWHPNNLREGTFSGWLVIGPVIGIVLTIALHELTHGLALRGYGARPQYGVLWKEMMFYATAPGYAFSRNAYLVIALAPLVVLSVVGMLLLLFPLPGWMAWTIIFCAALNVGSAVGDLWLARVALGYPSFARVMDEKDGLRVLMPVVEA